MDAKQVIHATYHAYWTDAIGVQHEVETIDNDTEPPMAVVKKHASNVALLQLSFKPQDIVAPYVPLYTAAHRRPQPDEQ